MLRESLWFLLGVALLFGAVYITHAKVIALQVGEHTSRLVGTLCAILAYYYLRHGFALHVPSGAWTAYKLLETAKVWLPPVVLFSMAGYYAVTIFRNWRTEFVNLFTSSAWIVVVAALAVAARYVLAR